MSLVESHTSKKGVQSGGILAFYAPGFNSLTCKNPVEPYFCCEADPGALHSFPPNFERLLGSLQCLLAKKMDESAFQEEKERLCREHRPCLLCHPLKLISSTQIETEYFFLLLSVVDF